MSNGFDPKKVQRGYNSYLRFTGLGLTMALVIGVFCFAGWWLDEQVRWRYPVLTILLSLLGITGAMVYLFKETGKK